LEDTVSPVKRAKAINAMKKMQETSVSLGNDKMTLEEINAVIKDVRRDIRFYQCGPSKDKFP